MHNAARLTLVLVLAAASPVLAQPGPEDADQVEAAPPVAPAAPLATVAQYPAPMTNSWGDVSHINGTLVPVGEKNQYIYKFRKTNISSNPIGWITGVYGLSASYAVHENVVVKGDVNMLNDFYGTDGYEVNATALVYFRRAYDGPFIEAGLIQREMHDHDRSSYVDCSDCGMGETERGPEVLFGWHRMFDSGLNVSAAVGAMRNVNAKDDEYSADNNIEPVGYFRAGYAF